MPTEQDELEAGSNALLCAKEFKKNIDDVLAKMGDGIETELEVKQRRDRVCEANVLVRFVKTPLINGVREVPGMYYVVVFNDKSQSNCPDRIKFYQEGDHTFSEDTIHPHAMVDRDYHDQRICWNGQDNCLRAIHEEKYQHLINIMIQHVYTVTGSEHWVYGATICKERGCTTVLDNARADYCQEHAKTCTYCGEKTRQEPDRNGRCSMCDYSLRCWNCGVRGRYKEKAWPADDAPILFPFIARKEDDGIAYLYQERTVIRAHRLDHVIGCYKCCWRCQRCGNLAMRGDKSKELCVTCIEEELAVKRAEELAVKRAEREKTEEKVRKRIRAREHILNTGQPIFYTTSAGASGNAVVWVSISSDSTSDTDTIDQ